MAKNVAEVEKKKSTNQVSAERSFGATRTREGVVVSDKMEKTVIVSVTRLVQHQSYGKYVKKTDKYFAHDEKNECKVGDLVRIIESRPLSKKKSWKVKEIVRKAV